MAINADEKGGGRIQEIVVFIYEFSANSHKITKKLWILWA
ncbi:hypothetical protein HMPREF0880_01354 [Yokenella regensburgei ATCC 43003]|nr:hypothetical protein HMPREF0880_01354 [Yokenella regensburgei ATCC 43003]